MRRLITVAAVGSLRCMHCGRAGRDRQQRPGAEGVEAAEVGAGVGFAAGEPEHRDGFHDHDLGQRQRHGDQRVSQEQDVGVLLRRHGRDHPVDRDSGQRAKRRFRGLAAEARGRGARDGDPAGDGWPGRSQGRKRQEGQEAQEGPEDHLPRRYGTGDPDGRPVASSRAEDARTARTTGPLACATVGPWPVIASSGCWAKRRDGSEAAWAEIFVELSPPVLGYLRANGAPDPEDVLSETFLQVARDIRAFNGDEAGFSGLGLHHRPSPSDRCATARCPPSGRALQRTA